MSSIGVVVFRNSPLKAQVLQESVNNSLNISNNDTCNVRREIVIVRKKQKIQTPNTVSVTSIVRAAEASQTVEVNKRPRLRENSIEEAARSPTPLAVARRNARERNRVRQVNDGFAALRRHIPDEVAAAFENANSNRGPNKKLSKVETLRMAVEYIRNLEGLLNIGYGDKENVTRPSLDSFPSPASSSPRETSQERHFYSIHSPALDDEELDEDELDSSINQITTQTYLDLPSAETFQLVSTPHLYDEEDGNGTPMTPSSDLLGQEDVHPHGLEGHFTFPNSAEQFTVISDQSYCGDKVEVSELKYSLSLSQEINHNYDDETGLPFDVINPDLILTQPQFKEETTSFPQDEQFSDIELKKELPDIHVTPEDREQFEETLKWWQEKTRQARALCKTNN